MLQSQLFNIVDQGSVCSSINAMNVLILPQMLHCIQYINSLSCAEKVDQCSSNDILEALSVIYEYGEMQTTTNTDTIDSNTLSMSLLQYQPIILFSQDANKYLVQTPTTTPTTNNNNTAGSSKGYVGGTGHLLIEGCEPSCSIR